MAELIREAATVTAIDLDRVYLIGHSNGGFMGYRMACDYPDMIRGVISISGAFFADPRLCKNPGRLNLLQIHGSNDSVVDFRGRFGFPGAKQSVKYWVNSQSCNQEATVRRHQLNLMPFYASNKAAGYETDSYVWDSCQNEAHVGLWKVNGADHMPFFKSTWLAEALYFVK
ncbi:MAG: alpha/beta fold hydrolase [Proteobacteria bacterium]|nr:alpha/beta fold hydrolase [Pseudomonadota bacterium]